MSDLEFIRTNLQAAGSIVMKYRRRARVHEKMDAGLVTTADLASERFLINAIEREYSEDQISSEEAGVSGGATASRRRVWILDPLDGTTNFVHGIPHYSVTMARGEFCEDGSISILAGGVYQPMSGELFLVDSGGYASVNGEAMPPLSRELPMNEALIAGGLSYHRGEMLSADCERIAVIGDTCRSIRISGSCALDMAYVAAGRLDAFVEIGVKPWDIAAGSALVRMVGGTVVSFSGRRHGEFDVRYEGIVCGKHSVVREILQLLKSEEVCDRMPR